MFPCELLYVSEPGAGEHRGQHPGGHRCASVGLLLCWVVLPLLPLPWLPLFPLALPTSLLHSSPPALLIPTPQVAGAVSSFFILIIIIKLGELFQDLPKVSP